MVFLFFNVLKYLFYNVFLNINQNWAKTWAKKTIPFHILQNIGSWKNRFVATPLLTKNGVFQLCFLKPKTLMLNKKHNLKSGKNKDKNKGLERKTRQETPKKQKNSGKIAIWCFDVVPFMKQKQRRKKKKKKKERKKQKKQKKMTRRKKIEQERDREREIEKGGGQKRLRRNKGRHSKINKKCPFPRENRVFCLLKAKKRKEKKQKQNKTKKYGGLRAKWGGPSGHLTRPLTPPKKQQKTNTNKTKKNKNPTKKQQIKKKN